MRWRYNDPSLVWLLVGTYALHVIEEYAGGFPEWLATVFGRPLPRAGFILINVVGFTVMIVAARLSTTRESRGWMAIAIATVAFVNGLVHFLASLASGTWSPGLLTGVVLYLPLGLLALVRGLDQTPAAFFWRGVSAGVVAHVLVTVVALLASS